MPTLLLDGFIGSNTTQMKNARDWTDCDPFGKAPTMQPKSLSASNQRRDCTLGSEEEEDNIDMTDSQPRRQLTVDYIIRNMKSRPQNKEFLTRATNRPSSSAARTSSCRSTHPPQTEWVEAKPCFSERPSSQVSGRSSRAATAVPQSIERQKRSFLRAQYVCRARKTKYREKKPTDKPPDADKVRQMIKQRDENSSSRLGMVNACSRRDETQSQQWDGATWSERTTNTLRSLMASRLRNTQGEPTPVPRPQSAPPLPIQNAVSLTGLRPASACRTYRPEKADSYNTSDQVRRYGSSTSFNNSFPTTATSATSSQLQVTARKIRRTKRT